MSDRYHLQRLYDAIRGADDARVDLKLPRSAFKSEFEWRMAVIDLKSMISNARYEERMRAIDEARR